MLTKTSATAEVFVSFYFIVSNLIRLVFPD